MQTFKIFSATTGLASRPLPRNLPIGAVQRRALVQQRALGDSGDKSSKGILRREDEPEEYWTSEAEKAGKNPFQDPLAQIGLLAIFFPFIFLALAIAFGWVDLSGGR